MWPRRISEVGTDIDACPAGDGNNRLCGGDDDDVERWSDAEKPNDDHDLRQRRHERDPGNGR
jgi:hypothetical protein